MLCLIGVAGGIPPALLLLTTPSTVVPVGQAVQFTITGQRTAGETLQITNLTQSFTIPVQDDHATTTNLVSSPRAITYEAQLIQRKTGAILGVSPPIVIDYTFVPNGTNHGYTGTTGPAFAWLTGLTAATQRQHPALMVDPSGRNFRHQWWWGTAQGWHSTAFTAGDTHMFSDLPPGLVSLTAYVNRTTFPDRKPYLTKVKTVVIAGGESFPAGWTVTPSVSSIGQSVRITAPKGYAAYQFWWAPQGGTNGQWTSSGEYSPRRSVSVAFNEPGAWKVTAYGRTAGGHSSSLGSLLVNVND